MTANAERPRLRELNATIRYTMWSVFRAESRLPERPCRAGGRGRGAVRAAGRQGRHGPRGVRRVGPARRRRPDGLVALRLARRAAGRVRPVPPHRARPAPARRSGRRWRCTGRPSSTRATSRRSWPTRSRAATCACTRSCARTSGTCCPTPSGARCSPSTARWRAATRTCGPTPWPRSRSATTSGCSRSRPTSCTASSTSCATCGPRARGGTCARRCRSSPDAVGPSRRVRSRLRAALRASGLEVDAVPEDPAHVVQRGLAAPPPPSSPHHAAEGP